MNLILLRFFFLLMLHACCSGSEWQREFAKLKSKKSGRPNTSSTLLWKRYRAGDQIPRHAVPVNGADNPHHVWCRGTFNGVKVPGAVDINGTCVFALASVVHTDTYDVLVSYEGSARVKSLPWDSWMAKPENSVLSPHRIPTAIPVSLQNSSSQYIAGSVRYGGIYHAKDNGRTAFYPREGAVRRSKSGFVLVEDEPVRYQLANITFKTKYQKMHTVPYELNVTQLINLGSSEKLVSTTMSYILSQSHYWGNLNGIVKELSDTFSIAANDRARASSGLNSTLKRVMFSSINYHLPAMSKVNVTVIGSMEIYEAPYDGIITAIYDDGYASSRPITSSHESKRMTKVIVSFDSPTYLNGTAIDAAERSNLLYEYTTTTTSTTSTTTTTTTTPPPTTTAGTTPKTTPVLHTEMFSSPATVPQRPSYISSSSRMNDIRAGMSKPTMSLENINVLSSGNAFAEGQLNIAGKEELKSTSDRIISVLSTIFTGLVFWYFSLGIMA